MRLEGKVALISGGARGMGATEARLFAREGARVVVGDVLDYLGGKVVAEIEDTGGEAHFVRLDVTSETDWQDAVAETVKRFGKLDVLVNNAGIYRETPLVDTSEEEWDKVMDVNAKGVFLGAKSVIPAMKEAGGGSIVNISSTAGIIGSFRGSAYGASKAAVRQLTKNTAVQVADYGIRSNSIHPGPIETDMIAKNIATAKGRAASIARVPLGRIGSAEDVAYGALFLASDESSFMTGAELSIDGGVTAQ